MQRSQGDKQKCQSTAYDIFKGHLDRKGRVIKMRSLGTTVFNAEAVVGLLQINGLPKGCYYLVAENDPMSTHDFTIFYSEDGEFNTNEPIGVGFLLTDKNAGLIRLEWDIFGVSDMYVNISSSLEDDALERAA